MRRVVRSFPRRAGEIDAELVRSQSVLARLPSRRADLPRTCTPTVFGSPSLNSSRARSISRQLSSPTSMPETACSSNYPSIQWLGRITATVRPLTMKKPGDQHNDDTTPRRSHARTRSPIRRRAAARGVAGDDVRPSVVLERSASRAVCPRQKAVK